MKHIHLKITTRTQHLKRQSKLQIKWQYCCLDNYTCKYTFRKVFEKKNEFAIITHDINKQVSAPRSSYCDTDRQTVKRQLRDRQTDSGKTGQRVRQWVVLLHTELTGGIAGHICHPGRQKERKPLQSPA